MAAERKQTASAENVKRFTNMTFTSIVLCVAAAFMPLFPLVVTTAGNRRTLYNMIGVVNQEVGADLTRDEAYPLLIIYIAAIILITVGIVNAYNRLSTSSVFLMGGAAMMIGFTFVWINADNPSHDAARTSLANSFLPYVVLIFATGAFVCALLELLSDKPVKRKKPVHKSRKR